MRTTKVVTLGLLAVGIAKVNTNAWHHRLTEAP
jgi:hypothetical protein